MAAAVRNGITTKELKEVNGWGAKEDVVIYEGQMLFVPVKRTAQQEQPQARTAPQPAAAPKPVQEEGCPSNGSQAITAQSDLWSYPGSRVKRLGRAEVEALLRASSYNPARQDTLLVVYAPWCPYCQALEATVEQLAQGLANDRSVQVARIRGDLPELRSWTYQARSAAAAAAPGAASSSSSSRRRRSPALTRHEVLTWPLADAGDQNLPDYPGPGPRQREPGQAHGPQGPRLPAGLPQPKHQTDGR